MTKFTTAELHTKVEKALLAFFRKDRDLLCLKANERSITHKLAEHLQHQFADLDVDCEYNRHGYDVKRLTWGHETTRKDCTHAKTVYPDIIVHKRGCDDINILVIEVKKSDGGDPSRDMEKLSAFTDPNGEYKYKLGLFLEFDVCNKKMNHAECFPLEEQRSSCPYCERLSDISGSASKPTSS